jgi:cell division GTPase FtsZ
MKRRDLIKSLGILGVSGLVPGALLNLLQQPKKYHFIGLGGAGSNFVEFVHTKGVKHPLTCFSYPMRTKIASDINFILYKRPFEILDQAALYDSFRKAIIPSFELPPQLVQILNSESIPVLCCGIGGQTGTSLLKASIQYLNSINKPFIVAATTPFAFETAFFKKEVNRLIYENKHSKHFHIIKKHDLMAEFGDHTFDNFFRMVDELLWEKVLVSIKKV